MKLDKQILIAEINYIKAIADDIIKHKASKEICKYADIISTIDSPFNTSGGEPCDDWIRINVGNCYTYVMCNERKHTRDAYVPNGEISYNLEDYGVKELTTDYGSYDTVMDAISKLPDDIVIEDYDWVNDEGKQRYINNLNYVPYKPQKAE